MNCIHCKQPIRLATENEITEIGSASNPDWKHVSGFWFCADGSSNVAEPNEQPRSEKRRTGQSMNYARARGIQNGDPERSGGPMAATVDRVMNICTCSTCVESEKRGKINAATIQLWYRDVNLSQMDLQTLHAAIRRAAEKAAAEICNPKSNCGRSVEEWEKVHAESIERHLRQELGL